MKEIYMLVLIMLLISGCKDDPVRIYTAVDAHGKEWKDLTFDRSGLGWVTFYTKEGKRVAFQGNYSYVEQ